MKMPNEPKKNSRMSDAAVQAKTGKTWSEWFKLLDKAGAKKMNHKEIVAYLKEHHNPGAWWQQMITVTYEQARGLREKYEKAGGFSANASKTIAVPLAKLYQAWSDTRQRNRWLGEKGVVLRSTTPEKSMRLIWSDGKSKVLINFYAKGESKSQVAIEHEKLANATAATKMKTFWGERLNLLKEKLEA